MPSIIVVCKSLNAGELTELFVAAVTEDSTDAERLVAQTNFGSRTTLIKSNASAWPVYINEDDLGFTLLETPAIAVAMQHLLERRLSSPRSPDIFAANIYRVTKPYIPDDVARDSMGSIDHFHVTDANAEEIALLGFDAWVKARHGPADEGDDQEEEDEDEKET